MPITSDPDDPRLGHGIDRDPVPMSAAYLVLSQEDRAKEFVRPVRDSYRHTGTRPRYPTRPLTLEEQSRYTDCDYACFEPYPESESPKLGRFWTTSDLTSGCGEVTTMNRSIAETYARDVSFYGTTYCCHCQKHLPVGDNGEFRWIEPDGSLGPAVGT